MIKKFLQFIKESTYIDGLHLTQIADVLGLDEEDFTKSSFKELPKEYEPTIDTQKLLFGYSGLVYSFVPTNELLGKPIPKFILNNYDVYEYPKLKNVEVFQKSTTYTLYRKSEPKITLRSVMDHYGISNLAEDMTKEFAYYRFELINDELFTFLKVEDIFELFSRDYKNLDEVGNNYTYYMGEIDDDDIKYAISSFEKRLFQHFGVDDFEEFKDLEIYSELDVELNDLYQAGMSYKFQLGFIKAFIKSIEEDSIIKLVGDIEDYVFDVPNTELKFKFDLIGLSIADTDTSLADHLMSHITTNNYRVEVESVDYDLEYDSKEELERILNEYLTM